MAVQGQGYKVCSLCFARAYVYKLLGVGVPASFSAQLDPCISNAVMPAEARALCTRESMITIRAELLVTSTARGQRRVLTPLPRLEDRKSQVLLNGKSQGAGLEEAMV